jgi:flagellin
MADIVLTAGVRSNLLQLQQTSDLITATQTKLATGKRVNSALDNPTNYFTAQSLSNRASDLGNLLDSMSTAFNTIQAANNGITSITQLVQSAQALVSQAQQTSDTATKTSL